MGVVSCQQVGATHSGTPPKQAQPSDTGEPAGWGFKMCPWRTRLGVQWTGDFVEIPTKMESNEASKLFIEEKSTVRVRVGP